MCTCACRSTKSWRPPKTPTIPLIRSPEAWKQRHASSDAGHPEDLAYKIEVFEACDRRSGYEVRAPRIPGLAYREDHDLD